MGWNTEKMDYLQMPAAMAILARNELPESERRGTSARTIEIRDERNATLGWVKYSNRHQKWIHYADFMYEISGLPDD